MTRRIPLYFLVMLIFFGGALSSCGEKTAEERNTSDAVAKAEEMMSAVCAGDFESATNFLRGIPSFDVIPADSSALDEMLWNAFQNSLSYTVQDSSETERGVAVGVTVRGLDVASLVQFAGLMGKDMLVQHMSEVEDCSELYDSNHNFRQDLVERILEKAVQQTLDENPPYWERKITLSLAFEQGEWWIEPDGELTNLLSGGWATGANKTNYDIVANFLSNEADAIEAVTNVIMDTEKKFWIHDTAPEPDSECFGESTDPEALADVIQAADKLLNGQSLFYSTDVILFEDSKIRYYLDETILAITWKQAIDDTVYTFSEIKIADPSQFRRFLAGGAYGSEELAIPTELAYLAHAVVASSGDYYKFRNAGVIVYDGKVCSVGSGADTCYITRNGNLLFTPIGSQLSLENAQAFVDENQILFSLAFGPILVENGEKYDFGSYGLGEVGDPFARAALCQMDELHYLLVNANAEGDKHAYPTMYAFAEQIFQTGCQSAYALDGGQTAVIVMDGELVNQVTYGYQRKISDIIYFATALPNS